MQLVNCYNCNKQIELPDGVISRYEECPQCQADVKVCKNCNFYDINAYNECRESSAERVPDKEKSNMCDYFKPGSRTNKITDSKSDALKKLDDLFKK